jgi:hypothetical protein
MDTINITASSIYSIRKRFIKLSLTVLNIFVKASGFREENSPNYWERKNIGLIPHHHLTHNNLDIH